MTKKTVVLTILDGWGVGEKHQSNPIYVAPHPFIDELRKKYFFGVLSSSGISVGLPWGEEGNCEAGHLSLGTGQIVYQDYPRISLAIRNKTFFKNPLLKEIISYCRKNKSNLHLIGLLSSGNIIASYEHIIALLKLAKIENFSNVFLDLFTDGINSKESAYQLLEKLEKASQEEGLTLKISFLSGRFFGIDSNSLTERERAYQTLIRGEKIGLSPKEVLEKNFKNNVADQFIEPVSFGPNIKDNDGVIFFNFNQSANEKLIPYFLNSDYGKMFIIGFVPSEKFSIRGAFPPSMIINYLSKILSEKNKIQIKITESLKTNEICSFFNAYKPEILPNEYRVIVPSSNSPYPQENPKMKAEQITTKAIISLKDKAYDFILINYPNPWSIGKSGDYEAALAVVKIIDEQLKKLSQEVERQKAAMIITSDHGCLEKIKDPMTGLPLTSNTTNPVPFYLIDEKYKRFFTKLDIEKNERAVIGLLCDVAPTILDLMGIEQPPEMDGNSLLPLL